MAASEPHFTSQVPGTGLPDELWGEIWAQLSLCDLVRASHVCRDWRASALANSSLWTELDIRPTLHGMDCPCRQCYFANWPQRRLSFGACKRRIAILIERSADAPLTCKINSMAEMKVKEYDAVIQMLAAHSTRMSSLSIYTETSARLRPILRGLLPMPRLKRLTIDGRAGYCSRMSLASLGLPTMPALTALSLTHFIVWDSVVTIFPSLQCLDSPFATPGQLAHALQSCPGLAVLHAWVGFEDLGSQALRDTIRSSTSRLRELNVTALPTSWTADDLETIAPQQAQKITLDYGYGKAPAHPLHAPGVYIMRHLHGPASLQCTGEHSMSVVGADSNGRTRAVQWSMASTSPQTIDSLWAALSAVLVTALYVDWTLKDILFGATAGSYPSATSLTLRVPPYFGTPLHSIRAGSAEFMSGISMTLPLLEKVTVQSDEKVRLPADELSDFLMAICPGRRVRLLELCNVDMYEAEDGTGAQILGLADRVHTTNS